MTVIKNSHPIYKGIYFKKRENQWFAQIWVHGKRIKSELYPDPREAAIQYDKMCITYGREPVNVLKRKK